MRDRIKQLLESGVPEAQVIGNILDYPKPELDPKIWDKDNKLRSKIKKDIIDKIAGFLMKKGIHHKDFGKVIDKIIIIGSLTSYQWNSKSDLDVHVRINLDKLRHIFEDQKTHLDDDEIVKLLNKEWKHEVEVYTVKDTKHPIEYFFEVPGHTVVEYQDGVYNVETDEWEKEPRVVDQDVDPDKLYDEATAEAFDIIKEFDSNIMDIKRNIVDIGQIRETLKMQSKENKGKFKQKLHQKYQEIENKITDMVKTGNEIMDARPANYDHESAVNIKFKYLQRYKYIWLIKSLESILQDELTEEVSVEDTDDLRKVNKALKEFDKFDKPSKRIKAGAQMDDSTLKDKIKSLLASGKSEEEIVKLFTAGSVFLTAVIPETEDPEQWFKDARESDKKEFGDNPYSGSWATIPRMVVYTEKVFEMKKAATEYCQDHAEKHESGCAVKFKDDEGKLQWLVAGWAAE